jgi:hypothetical protein
MSVCRAIILSEMLISSLLMFPYYLSLWYYSSNISLQVSWGKMLDKKRVLFLESQVKHPNFQIISGT